MARAWDFSRKKKRKRNTAKPSQFQYAVDQSGLPEGVKRCSECLEVLPLDLFYKSDTSYRKRHSLCKVCWKMRYSRSEGESRGTFHMAKRKDWYYDEILNRDMLIVVHDPDGYWPKGNMFRWWDFMVSLGEGDIWTDGMILLRRSDMTKWMVKGTSLLRLTELRLTHA